MNCRAGGILGLLVAWASAAEHDYAAGDEVQIWADRIGPYDNPHETYRFTDLPLCELWEAGSVPKEMTLGEALLGHDLVSSPRISVTFGKDKKSTDICRMKFSMDTVKELTHMIAQNYWYAYQVDELPVYAFLGDRVTDEATGIVRNFVYMHRTFKIEKNGDKIISVDVIPSKPIQLVEDVEVTLSYDVLWDNSSVPFSRRYDKYVEESFFENKVHWFSVINSFALCIFLCAVVGAILLRTVKHDFAKFNGPEADSLESLDRSDEGGWKQLYSDVFRKPRFLMPLSIVLASGIQLFAMAVSVAFFGFLSNLFSLTHGPTTGSIFIYSFVVCQFFSGFTGAYILRLHNNRNWKRAAIWQFLFIPSTVAIVFTQMNTTAVAYGSTMALSFPRLIKLSALLCGVAGPLHALGTFAGRKYGALQSLPCRPHTLQRPIPQKPICFMPLMALVSGLVPFGSVFIEMHFIFSSFWGHKTYYLYGCLLCVVLLFTVVLILISITSCYILLNSEDYRWQWAAITNGATTALFTFVYGILFNIQSTKMSGFYQFVFFYGSLGLFSGGVALFCGSICYFGASNFVWLIYRNIKCD